MEQHEWKRGDRCLVEATVFREKNHDGDVCLETNSTVATCLVYANCDTLHPLPPDHSEWVGRPVCELPAGTVCDLHTGRFVIRVIWTGEEVRCCTPQDMPGDVFECDDDCTVIRIHKLGEVRPKTLGDEDAYVAWESTTGDIFWKDAWGDACFHSARTPAALTFERKASDLEICPNWTRLGPIEGIKIGGVIYGERE